MEQNQEMEDPKTNFYLQKLREEHLNIPDFLLERRNQILNHLKIPVIKVSDLFTELIIEESWMGWNIDRKSMGRLISWTSEGKVPGRRNMRLNSAKDIFIMAIPVSKTPLIINKENENYFEGMDKNIPKDGSMIGIKYAFFPNSILNKDDEKLVDTQPIYFYLFKDILTSDDLNMNSFFCEYNEAKWAVKCRKIISSNDCFNEICNDKFQILSDHPKLNLMLGQSAMLGNLYAQISLAAYAYLGRHKIPKDWVLARGLYWMAIKNGAISYLYDYAKMLANGEGGPKDTIGARNLYYLATSYGIINAKNNYAMMLYQGEGGPQDLVGAREIFHQLALKNFARAQNNFAFMLEKGMGGPIDLVMARIFYQKAIQNGSKTAKENYERVMLKLSSNK